jgi:hypothetical protein
VWGRLSLASAGGAGRWLHAMLAKAVHRDRDPFHYNTHHAANMAGSFLFLTSSFFILVAMGLLMSVGLTVWSVLAARLAPNATTSGGMSATTFAASYHSSRSWSSQTCSCPPVLGSELCQRMALPAAPPTAQLMSMFPGGATAFFPAWILLSRAASAARFWSVQFLITSRPVKGEGGFSSQ